MRGLAASSSPYYAWRRSVCAGWEEWIVLVCGAWVVASPWLLGFPRTVAMRVDVGIGIVVMYMAALELWLIH
jgi:hypothetical protein